VRMRTFLLVAVPLTVPIVFMLLFVPQMHERSLAAAAKRKAEALTTVIAVNAAAPITFDDTKALDTLLRTTRQDSDVVYAVVSGIDGNQLGVYGDLQVKRKTSLTSMETWEDHGMIHVASPILGPTRSSVGTIQAGFSTESFISEVNGFRFIALGLTAVVLVVAALMALLLGRDFTRLFDQLRRSIFDSARSIDEVVTQLAAVTAEQTAAASEEASALDESNTTAAEVGAAATAAAQRAGALVEGGGRAEERASSGLASVESATNSMGEVREQMNAIVTTIGALSQRAAAIGEIASTVAVLAERSNLLALNAAIEAARAGAQGRGFSVVAQEMRSLADGSNRSAGQVKVLIAEIQGSIGKAVDEVREGERRVVKTEQLADQAAESIRKFAEVTREFAMVGKEIAASATQQNVAIEQVVESIGHATQAGATQLETTRQVEETARRLRELAGQLMEVISSKGALGGEASA
jgi:methyl-accepting chemotaxis protein